MSPISYSEARKRLAGVWDETIATREPILIDRKGHESVVMMPAAEWDGLMDTVHLLKSPVNASRLFAALSRPEGGEGQ